MRKNILALYYTARNIIVVNELMRRESNRVSKMGVHAQCTQGYAKKVTFDLSVVRKIFVIKNERISSHKLQVYNFNFHSLT